MDLEAAGVEDSVAAAEEGLEAAVEEEDLAVDAEDVVEVSGEEEVVADVDSEVGPFFIYLFL